MSRCLMSWATIALGFVLSSPLPVQAQSLEESIPAGARVRVTLANETDPAGKGPSLVGRLAEVRPESILLTTGGSQTRELRRDAIIKLERSVHPSRKRRGALIGYGVALVAFGVLAGKADCGDQGTGTCVATVAALALSGAGIGALVAPGEHWADVPSTQVRVSVAPTRGRGLSVRVAFALP